MIENILSKYIALVHTHVTQSPYERLSILHYSIAIDFAHTMGRLCDFIEM